MAEVLGKKGLASSTQVAREAKEKLCRVAQDFEAEKRKAKRNAPFEKEEITWLADGSKVVLGMDRFKCPEILFDPLLAGIEADGIHEMTFKSIRRCDIDIRRHLFENVILSGGTTRFPGLEGRMKRELKELAPPNARICVIAPEQRDFSVWQGGSIMASLAPFQRMWITREEYDDSGPNVVHHKCH